MRLPSRSLVASVLAGQLITQGPGVPRAGVDRETCVDCVPENGNRLDNVNAGRINVCFAGKLGWNPEIEVVGFKRGIKYWTDCLPPEVGAITVTYDADRPCNLTIMNADLGPGPRVARSNGSPTGRTCRSSSIAAGCVPTTTSIATRCSGRGWARASSATCWGSITARGTAGARRP